MATKSNSVYPDGVHARRIIAISTASSEGHKKLILADHTEVLANQAAVGLFSPSVGDYYCVPSEGNAYLSSKSNFAVTYTTVV